MRLYKLCRELYAEPALQEDAECVIGRRINNFVHGNNGYITKDPETEELDWMPKSEFDKQATLVNIPLDKMRAMLPEIDKHIQFFYTVSKECGERFRYKRDRAYMIIRRLKALRGDVEKIINLELLDL